MVVILQSARYLMYVMFDADHIIDLRERRRKATAKRRFDAEEIKKRGQDYNRKPDNFTDYSDMNMRYLRISGIVQRKGRGLIIVPAKHFLAEKLAKTTSSRRPIMDVYKELCHGASLPMDDLETAKALLLDTEAQLKKNHVYYDLSDRPMTTVPEINAARLHLEELWQKTDEINYAAKQPEQWREISDYMTLLIKGGGKKDRRHGRGQRHRGAEGRDPCIPGMGIMACRPRLRKPRQPSQRYTRIPIGFGFPSRVGSRRWARGSILRV